MINSPDCRNFSTSLFHRRISSTQSWRCLGSSTGSPSTLSNGSIIHGCLCSRRTSSASPLPSSSQMPSSSLLCQLNKRDVATPDCSSAIFRSAQGSLDCQHAIIWMDCLLALLIGLSYGTRPTHTVNLNKSRLMIFACRNPFPRIQDPT